MRNLNSVPSLFSKIRTLSTVRKTDAVKPLSTLLPKLTTTAVNQTNFELEKQSAFGFQKIFSSMGKPSFNSQPKSFSFSDMPKNVIKVSESGKMAKIFSSFDLGSVQISFVGMIGEFAVWAIEDMLTGEIQYIVDDRKGSLHYFELRAIGWQYLEMLKRYILRLHTGL